MMALLRRVRAAFALGVLWAVPWGVAGALLSPYLRTLANAGPPQTVADFLVDAAFIAWYGFLAGVTFSVVLAVLGRRRSFAQLTPRTMAMWGVASALVLMTPPMVYMLMSRSDGWRPEDVVYLGGGLVLS